MKNSSGDTGLTVSSTFANYPVSSSQKEESFFVFTKKHDSWYIGDLQGNQKNICAPIIPSSSLNNGVFTPVTKEKKEKTKSNSFPFINFFFIYFHSLSISYL
jgi:hypothetical protein